MLRSVTKTVTSLLFFTAFLSSAAAQKAQVSIKSISPEMGPPGTEVMISGSNFAAEESDNRVFLGKQKLKILSVFPNSIKVVIPNGAKSGIIKVQTRKNGASQAPKPFTVLVPLILSGVSPTAAMAGEEVSLKGSGFDRNPQSNKVSLSGKPCKVIRVSPKELVVSIPSKAKSGTFKVEVPGQGPVETKEKFTVAVQPKITKFTPTSGRPGDTVTIRGMNFGNDAGAVEVRIGAEPCKILSVNDRTITVEITPATQSGAVQLAVNNIKSDPSKGAFTVKAQLKATKMDPLTVSPGGEVRIFGTGFGDKTADHVLTVGNLKIKATEVTTAYAAFKIPTNVSGGKNKVSLNVKNVGVINIPVPLTVIQPATITEFTPTSGSDGTTVTINGSNFGDAPNNVRVYLGRQYAQVLSVTPSAIVATIPNGAASSRITVQTRYNGTAVSKQTFTVATPLTATGFAPMSGKPDQQVRIYGQGFSSNPKHNRVTMGNVNVPVLQAAPNNLLVKIPGGASSGPFSISVKGGGSTQTPGVFQIVQAPPPPPPQAAMSISSITPTSGSVGTYVRITGQGFPTTGVRAYVGQTPAGIRVYSPTQAMIAIPNQAIGGPITLMTPTGARAISKENFQMVSDVSVNKFYPQSGRPGTTVTLYGNEFAPGKTQVYLGSQQLKVQPGSNATMLQVAIPENAESGPFRVLVAGRKEVRSVGAFKVLPPVTTFTAKDEPKAETVLASKPDDTPVIEKLMKEEPKEAVPAKKETPEKAPTMDELLGFESDGETMALNSFEPETAAAGDTITINGSGFGDTVDKVKAWVGTKPAKVIGCVPDMIMIEVPKGADKGKIKLRIAGKPPLTSKKEFTEKQ